MIKIFNYCRELEEKKFNAGQVILEEGGKSNKIYVLIEGEVVVEKDGININAVSDPGALFGEMSILLDKPHMATVKTSLPSRFYVAENGKDFLKSDKEVLFFISKLLATRLNSVTTYLVDFKNQFEDHESFHFTLVNEVLQNIINQQDDESILGSDRVTDDTN